MPWVCITLYAFKRETLAEKLWSAMLLRFQWQIEKLLLELGLKATFDSIYPHT